MKPFLGAFVGLYPKILAMACISLLAGCDIVSIPSQAAIDEPPTISEPAPAQPQSTELSAAIYKINSRLDSIELKLADLQRPPEPSDRRSEEPAVLPQVQVMGPENCAPCDLAIQQLNATGLFVAVKRADIPAKYVAIAARSGGYPVVIFNLEKSGEHYVCPWRGVEAFAAVYSRTVMVDFFGNSPKTGMSQPAAEYNDPIYYSGSGSQWTWPGDLRVHLTYPPHSLTTYQVRRMTRAQCIQAHSSYHNRYGAKAAAKTDLLLAKHDAREERKQNRYERGGLFVAIFGAPRTKTVEYRYTTAPAYQTYRTYYTAPVVRSYRVRAYSSFCPNC